MKSIPAWRVDAAVLEKMREALGADRSSDAPDLLSRYEEDHSGVRGSRPALVVYPHDRAQVQAIVRIASEAGLPLVPVSSGEPRFHGGTVPVRGGVIVDFSRMRQIIELDPTNRVARVEPGVTFGELVPALDRAGLRLNLPLAPRANKSVLASALEREVSVMPKYDFDFMDPLASLEVVYGSGDDFRTGSASGPGSPDEDLKADLVNPWGPGPIDYYRFLGAAQGTMGLVTWAALRVEIKPSLRRLHFVPIAEIGQAWAPVDQLLRKRVVDECLILDRRTLASLIAAEDSDIGPLAAELAPFTLIAGVAGYRRRPEERMALYEDFLTDICRGCGLRSQTTLPGAAGLEDAISTQLTVPWGGARHWKLRRAQQVRELLFLCPLSRFPAYVRQMAALVARSPVPDLEYGVYVQPAVQGRAAQCTFVLPVDARNRAAVEALFVEAFEASMDAGAFFSRPYGQWARRVYERYPDGAATLRRLKQVFDPAAVLNPGKLCF